MPWNLGDVTDAVAAAVPPTDPALIYDDAVTSWGDFDRRTNALARAFRAAGCVPDDKIAFLSRNHPGYIEGAFAGFRARLVHVNVNFRYTGEELHYIFDNSDAAVIVYGREFAGEIAALKPRLTKVKLFVEIGDGAPVNRFAQALDDLASGDATPLDEARSPDDLIFIYTGGTTGLPKGVMWPQGAMWAALGGGTPMPGIPGPASLEALQDQVRSGLGRNRIYIAPPLMHGTGFMMTVNVLGRGGSVVMSSNPSLDADDMLSLIDRHQCELTVIVGDAFSRPLVRALDAQPGKYKLSSLKLMVSSGTMWSPEMKQGILRHAPQLLLMDTLGASEGVGIGMSFSTAQGVAEVGKFTKDDKTIVVDEDGQLVEPGSGVIGRVARAGPLPLGYYKDGIKTDKTYHIIKGVRYSLAGDFATVEADGSIKLMGRGSQCINTAGEKVFPEEVEEVLKLHNAVDDALVVGVADEKWGQAVTAVVEASGPVTEDALRAHVRTHLAGYKTPKRVVFVDKVPRAPNGKADYKSAKALAEATLLPQAAE
jgi:3-oxocholest-4-en-26-oate---CoA ligase